MDYKEEEAILSIGEGSTVAGVWMPTSSGNNSKDFPSMEGAMETSVRADIERNKWKPVALPKGDSSKKTSSNTSSSNSKGSKIKKETNIKSPKEQEVETEVTIGKDELMKTILSKLVRYSAVIQGNSIKACITGNAHIELKCKKVAGRKSVTILSGLETLGISNELVSKDLQKLFACSVSVGDCGLTKAYQKQVVIQGSMMKQTEKYLHEKWNIPREVIKRQ